jgi:iron complex outermembrane receptor protein
MLGASLSALATTASAQSSRPTSAATSATLGEIVVTARRQAENLQNAPLTVDAVQAETLQKLNIKQFADLQGVVPGIALSYDEHGSGSSVSVRGVNFTVSTATQPTVALYINEAPVEANFIFHSMFDVGQVEVLKGPQGTLRGVSAPSGAITLTTRKPDLDDFGGYVDGTYAENNGRDVQGAINIPIIKGVFAIRVAGVWDQTDGDGVTSVNSSTKPEQINKAERISFLYQPTDNLSANLTYQHLDASVATFTQVAGPGPGAFSIGKTLYPATVDPAITPGQRLAVGDQASTIAQRNEIVTGHIEYGFLGNHLSYDGSYARLKFKSLGGSHSDTANFVPGFEFQDYGVAEEMSTTHELRLASDPSRDRRFDYTVGAYYRWDHVCCSILQETYLPGAFGATAATATNVVNPAYVLPVFITYPGAVQETSIFGGLTFHLPWDTELSGGVRHIWSIYKSTTQFTSGPGRAVAAPAIAFGGSCPAAFGLVASLYPGFCDAKIPLSVGGGHIKALETPTVYNVSLSHKITDDLMVYATTGTAFRPATQAIGVQGALTANPPANLATLINHPSETSKSYELGFKSTWFDHRARLNVAIYRQDFQNLVTIGPQVNYFNTLTSKTTSFTFAQSVNAQVNGIDVDTGFQITPDWSVTAQASYADGRNQGTPIPCNTGPVLSATNLVNLCPSHGSVSSQPLWSATFQTEYTHPVGENMDGFFRGLATYIPENTRVESFFTANSYTLVNLYGGIRSHDGAWELSIFAKNVFNTEEQTDSGSIALSSGISAPEVLGHASGYTSATMTPRRQVGINLHYAWGSR